MIDELKELNDQFFRIFAELHENKKFLGSEENYRFFTQRVFEQYQIEYKLLSLNCEIETQKEEFEINEKRAEYIPERWRKWNWRRFRRLTQENEAARLIAERIQTEADQYFDACEKRLQALQNGEEEADVQEKQEAQEQPEAPKKDDVKLSEEEKAFIQKKATKKKEKTKV